jgi:cystathionine beta-lyase
MDDSGKPGARRPPHADDATLLISAGRKPEENFGAVNPPVYHASTILFPTLEEFDKRFSAPVLYGRRGTPTTFALEDVLAKLERGAGTVLAPSGVSAITTTLLAFAKPGKTFLVPDNVYGPVRHFCDDVLKDLGVKTVYYLPDIGAGIDGLIGKETGLIWLESPGSNTFELQDIPAITAVARSHGITTVIDNSWAAGYFLKPLTLGVDISVHAVTKYVGGHSDVMMGAVVCNEMTLPRVRKMTTDLGICVGPDDVFLALRGLRTLGPRMDRHFANGMTVARWLEGRPEVLRVLHPGLESDPYHDLWKRDFTGASGLFGIVLREKQRQKLAALLDGLKHFGMGASWGGFESLLIPADPGKLRSATTWNPGGQTLRIHVGLDDPDDLIADLEAGFSRLRAAA